MTPTTNNDNSTNSTNINRYRNLTPGINVILANSKTILIWTIVLIVMSTYYSNEPAPTADTVPLNDLLHSTLPRIEYKWHHYTVLGVVLFGTTTMLFTERKNMKNVLDFVVSYLGGLGIYLIVRGVIVNLTRIPRPRIRELYDPENPNGKTALQKLTTLSGYFDSTPSGHTGTNMIMLFKLFGLKKINAGVMGVLVTVVFLVPILTRAHYSLDVILAFLISFGVSKFKV